MRHCLLEREGIASNPPFKESRDQKTSFDRPDTAPDIHQLNKATKGHGALWQLLYSRKTALNNAHFTSLSVHKTMSVTFDMGYLARLRETTSQRPARHLHSHHCGKYGMCGISAYVQHVSGAELSERQDSHYAAEVQLETSLNIVAHRGPDARGRWFSEDHRVGKSFLDNRE